MTSPARKFAGRIAVAVLLVMLAAGSVFAAAATLPEAAGPNLAEPAATASPKADKSPKPEKSPDADKAADAARAADADGTPSPANLDRIVARLKAAGITTTSDALAALAAKVGVGGAIRVLRFAKASVLTPEAILALFESGKGWGVIARELNLTVGPGNGSVMGQGHGRDTAAKAADRAARAAAKTARIAERARQKAAERAARGAGSDD